MPSETRNLRVTATALNIRDRPSTSGAILGQVELDQILDWHSTSTNAQWHEVSRGSLRGFGYYQFLVPTDAPSPIDDIVRVAATSAIATYSWLSRGRAPAGYVKGMALCFGRMFYKLQDRDPGAIEMAKAATSVPPGGSTSDVLTYYAMQFRDLRMSNEAAGITTLRHLFALMLGLGMRESSGRYCEGRDRSAPNVTADTAEAGLFQTSWNIRSSSALLPALFRDYKARPTAGFRDIFAEGVTVRAGDLENFGTGEGRDFQELSKSCPAFAVEVAAIGLRNRRSHWGPINRRDAELRADADRMFLDVQHIVETRNLRAYLL